MSVLQRLPFPVALVILAAATAGGVVASARFHAILYLVATLVGVGAFAVLYLREYAQLPGLETRPKPVPISDAPTNPTDSETVPPTAPAEPVAEAHAPPDTGPVEVDRFDPEYDPVAEADEIETHLPAKPAPPPES